MFGCSDGSARRRQRQKQREAHGFVCLGVGQPSRWGDRRQTPCKVLQRELTALRTVFWRGRRGPSRRARRPRGTARWTGKSRNSGSKSARGAAPLPRPTYTRDLYTRCGQPRHPRPQQRSQKLSFPQSAAARSIVLDRSQNAQLKQLHEEPASLGTQEGEPAPIQSGRPRHVQPRAVVHQKAAPEPGRRAPPGR